MSTKDARNCVVEEVLPNKNWKDRYSDIRLDAEEAQILSDKWDMYLEKNQ